jgi:hypothetical protein
LNRKNRKKGAAAGVRGRPPESQLPDQLRTCFNRGLKQQLLEWIHRRSIEAA